MKYLSICSGIEAASVAWHPWTPVAFAETEPFPCAVLAHHYPGVPNWGDVNGFAQWPRTTVDVLIGGTPCQSFSVAGLRGGMADPRGNLALVYLAIAERHRPEWLVWENVPGVLSSNGGRDFGAFIGGLEQLGYHAAWRVLDAQHVRVDGYPRAVPQRRRRVFVVGHLGDWRRAAAVLFERESLSGDSPPRRQAGERAAPTTTEGFASSGDGFWRNGIGPLRAREQDSHENLITRSGLIASTGDISHCLNAGGMGRIDYETETLISHALRADGFDASEDGTGRGTPLVAAFDMRGRDGGSQFEGPHDTANIRAGSGGSSKSYVAQSWAVRRLTPTECERLQGFPDGYTAVPYRGRMAADGPRYKALGNSMAVNVMRWLGRRIELVAGM